MPLDGFSIVDWAISNFAGTSAPLLAGLGILLMLVAVFTAGWGFRVAPVSWSLVAGGVSLGIVAYYVIASAIDTGTDLEGGRGMTSSAASVVPWATAITICGYSFYAMRLGWRSLTTDDAAAKFSGFLVSLGAFFGVFLAVQVVRGGTGISRDSSGRRGVIANPAGERDDPVRHRGVTRPPRR